MADTGTYGTLITEDRYNGTYNGGAPWLAIPDAGKGGGVFDVGACDAFAGDVECGEWWRDNPGAERVGRGQTPSEAYEDMLRRNR